MRLLFKIAKTREVFKLYKVNAHVMGVGLTLFEYEAFGDAGKANYLEVLKAQESLLSAQLDEATNLYNGAQALIALYIALGGATK